MGFVQYICKYQTADRALNSGQESRIVNRYRPHRPHIREQRAGETGPAQKGRG